MLTVLLSLGLILGGFVAVAWFARRYLPGMGAQGAVKVVGTTAVGARERVVVVEVDNTWLLLGVGGGNVRLLHTLPRPADSTARWRSAHDENDSGAAALLLMRPLRGAPTAACRC